MIAMAVVLLCADGRARADIMYISYSNGDNYVEKYSSSGNSGINTDLGPLSSTTLYTHTPNGIAFDSQGNLYVANNSGANGTITVFAPDDSYLGVFATGLNQPASIAFDLQGNLYVACSGNSTIRKITTAGVSTVFVSSGLSSPQGLAFGPNGNLYVSDVGSNSIKEITPAGQMSTFYQDGSYTILNQVGGLAFDAVGNLYVASYRNHTVEKISPAGEATVFASNGTDPDNPDNPLGVYNPIGLAFDSSGNLFVANFHHTQVPGMEYEGHGISYTDEFSPTGTLLDAFTNNDALPGSDLNLRDANYIAIKTNAGVPVLNPIPVNPYVITPTSVDITAATAMLGGNVISAGGAAVTARGVVYAPTATNSDPQIGGNGVVNVTGTGTSGVFTVGVSSLTLGTGYTFKAYAINSVGTGYSPAGSFTTLSAADISVEQPADTGIASGGTRTLVTPAGTPVSLTFTIRNPGGNDLNGLTITKDGTNAADFTVTASPASPVAPAGTTTFTVQFAPAAGGAATVNKTAALHIASNVVGKSPYDINLTGTALSYNSSTNNDGMSDAAKFLLSPLGFNWQASQPALVNTYYANANAANLYSQVQYDTNRTAGRNDVINTPNTYSLYTLSQVQALNVGVPLLAKNPATGVFTLTISVKKTASLGQLFTDFPMTAPQTTINAQGNLEFQFTVPDNAAFFRLQSQ